MTITDSSKHAVLSSFAENVYSQFGEDGIIREILSRIAKHASTNSWCVEFGAWDGVYLSNTCRLIRDDGYSAVLIEGDAARHATLCSNLPQQNVHKICRFVTLDGESTLDKILQTTPIPRDFDFLSIDIDGCDYYVLESLSQFCPKVICIEFNPSIPNEVHFVQERDFGIKQGSSPLAILQLVEKKGYRLVAVTACNLLLVREDLAGYVIGEARPTLAELRDDKQSRTFLFFGFDGSVLSNQPLVRLPWHNVELSLQDMQILPKMLRKYTGDYGFGLKHAFKVWSTVNRLRGIKSRAERVRSSVQSPAKSA